ncbi:hypothetical protein [Geodermatophilus sp. SYSU D01036]
MERRTEAAMRAAPAAVLLPAPPRAATQNPGPALPRTPAELHVGLQRLKRLFIGGEPAALRSGLAPVENGRDMLVGTSVTALQTRFTARHNGLLVPLTAVGQPLDLAGAYITGSELFGEGPLQAMAVRELARRCSRPAGQLTGGTPGPCRQRTRLMPSASHAGANVVPAAR